MNRKNRNFVTQMEQLLRLMTAKNINVREGKQACTDGKKTVFLPPLPEDATDDDRTAYLGTGCHEGSHHEGESEPWRMEREQVKHFLQNAVDDIRCESLQEKNYHGLVAIRRDWYRIMYEKFWASKMPRMDKSDIKEFVSAMGCYMIFKVRSEQLEDMCPADPSPELQEAYDKYFKDMEPAVKAVTYFDQALELGLKLFDRVKDMIREDMEKDMIREEMEKVTPPPKAKPSKKEKSDDASAKDPSPESDPDDDSSDGKDAEDSGADASKKDETPEEKGDDVSTSDASDKEEPVKEKGDKGNEKPTDDKSDTDAEDSEESEGEKDDTADGDEGTTAEPGKDEDSPETDDAGESDATEVVDSEELAKWKMKIEEGVEDALKDMERYPELKDIAEMHKEAILKLMESADGPYCVDPSVRDYIGYNAEGSDSQVQVIHEAGMRYLGAAGSKLTRLFVSQSRERTVYSQHEGRIDLPAVISDVYDTRTDLFSVDHPGSIDKAAVSFMIDNSSSMGGVIGQVYAILDGFLFYLSKARIPTEAVGFTCPGMRNDMCRDKAVTLTIVKKFEDPYSKTVARRCVPPEYLDQNCEVDCLKYMVPRLYARPEGKKILIVLGDGQPSNGNYILSEKLGRAYKKYLQDCRDAGIIVFGFGIGCDLSEYFNEDFVSVNTDDMGPQILSKLTEIINRKKNRYNP